MGQFEKNWTRKIIAIDITLLEDPDLLIAATELNERLLKKVKKVFITAA